MRWYVNVANTSRTGEGKGPSTVQVLRFIRIGRVTGTLQCVHNRDDAHAHGMRDIKVYMLPENRRIAKRYVI